MVFQLSTNMMNKILDQYEQQMIAESVTAPILRLRTGTKPTNCATADAGTVVATITFTLGSGDFMSNASGGTKAFVLPLNATGAAGILGHYRIYAGTGGACMEQGTITVTGSGGDMTVDNVNVSAGQTINITSWIKDLSAHV